MFQLSGFYCRCFGLKAQDLALASWLGSMHRMVFGSIPQYLAVFGGIGNGP